VAVGSCLQKAPSIFLGIPTTQGTIETLSGGAVVGNDRSGD
jgi:hypothetical protein